MASKDLKLQKPKKRKDSEGSTKLDVQHTKKAKLVSTNPAKQQKKFQKPKLGQQTGKSKFINSESGGDKDKNVSLSKKEGRQRAKELAEARKKKRKRHYNLEQELASLWEKMRRRDIGKEERSKLISEAVQKMKGKIPDIAGSHVSSRVLQTCVKYCSQAEREAVFTELQPHLLSLASNTYAVHLLKKMLDNASKQQLAVCISSLRGHVAPLLRHMVGSVVVEYAYQLGNAAQKQELLAELYSAELQLFKGLTSMTEKRVVDIITKLGLQKGAVIRHMITIIQPILEKGIVDHSIIHKLLIEYLTIADKTSAADVIQQLSGPHLVRMIHTRDGSRLAMLCIKHGSAKERKKIIKGMKGHVEKIAHDQYGSLVLACVLSTVDDTKLVSKIIVRELQATLKDLVIEKNGRRPLLQLLHPNYSRYLSPDELASFDLSVPSLCMTDKSETTSQTKEADGKESCGEKGEQEDKVTEHDEGSDAEENIGVAGGKKDPLLRRQELLVKSGLAESLVQVCIENAEELLKSNFGKEIMYEVVTGGSDGILRPSLDEKLNSLNEAIAYVAANPKHEPEESEHVLENFHSSRTIRRLVLDCPLFASALFNKALSGKSRPWAQGHSAKVISAFLETKDPQVREMAKEELQPLVDEGLLSIPQTKNP
ncbi:PREDICTED: pumilio homolog 24 [Tarenaya hassleriana]|uniref:pumilio homolog 24 n=1 Tax=Tarenaya hassleriana TaxID=28532 RepID=UPI00053C7680|nr:PREDICTED: pumilio homolog 24 [Tarenaya hassleriana]